MSNPYPNRDVEELYVEHISVWEEVESGELSAEEALEYMRVDPDSDLWVSALEALTDNNPPL